MIHNNPAGEAWHLKCRSVIL